MKISQKIQENERLRYEPAWNLLAADNGPKVIAFLYAHLYDGPQRLSTEIMHEKVSSDLSITKEQAKLLVRQWLAEKYIERTFDAKNGEEIYELSSSSIQAIRFVENLRQRRTVATESRLSMVIKQLLQLVSETEHDPESRVKSLLEEQERLQHDIDAIRAGDKKPLEDDRALERLRDIVVLVTELVNDFRHVRDSFTQLNRQLREQIIKSEESRGGVLEELFAGFDDITESESGRAFTAFWRLLTDPQQSTDLEVSLDQIMERKFTKALTRDDRKFLSNMTKTLLERGSEVHDTLQFFARSLKQYVSSREYLDHRRFTEQIKEAQRMAVEVKNIMKPIEWIGLDLHHTSIKISSIAQLRLYDATLHEPATGIEVPKPPLISLSSLGAMVANSEINFRQLRKNIISSVVAVGQITVGEILKRYPADQGLGSVVGYLSLGVEYGNVSPDGEETVCWNGVDGISRGALIPLVYFQKGCFDGKKQAARH